MENKDLKVLAINSFPANGNAGLKMVMSVLGTHVIPVPTLLLSGIGSMKGYQRYDVPFEQMLKDSLALARANGHQLVVYVGYLGHPQQADVILEYLTLYEDMIRFVLVDPVCGDNGKAYVSKDLIHCWHPLLLRADIALPNITEVALLSGARGSIQLDQPEVYLPQFRLQYPALEFIVTGITEESKVVNQWFTQHGRQVFAHPYLPYNFSGTGDTFASLFIFFAFFKGQTTEQAILKAGLVMEMLISYSIQCGSSALLIYPEFREHFDMAADE
ncbi:MAG: bifunctional hydroxymethylpyrimidine kinase/phosphomethylpyrimidine kinase [Bacteroidota bacterium]